MGFQRALCLAKASHDVDTNISLLIAEMSKNEKMRTNNSPGRHSSIETAFVSAWSETRSHRLENLVLGNGSNLGELSCGYIPNAAHIESRSVFSMDCGLLSFLLSCWEHYPPRWAGGVAFVTSCACAAQEQNDAKNTVLHSSSNCH